MVLEYLYENKQNLENEKSKLSDLIKKNDLSIMENTQLMNYINSSEDRNYDCFSPINEINHSNEKKMNELKLQQKELQERKIEYNKNLDLVDEKLEKLECIISKVKVFCTEENSNKEIQENVLCNIEDKLIAINHKINLCKNILDVDKNRCKIEMKSISEMIDNLINIIDNR